MHERSLILPQPWVMKLVSNTRTFQVSICFDGTCLKADFIFAGKTRNHKEKEMDPLNLSISVVFNRFSWLNSEPCLNSLHSGRGFVLFCFLPPTPALFTIMGVVIFKGFTR